MANAAGSSHEARTSYIPPVTVKTTDTPVRAEVTLSDADREMLAALPPDERELIERVLYRDPKLTIAKAIEVLRAFSI